MVDQRSRKRDPEKMRAYRRAWYRRNPEKAYERKKQRRQEMISWLREYKGTLACLQCGETHPACLDFHHRDRNEKDFRISALGNMGWSKERVLTEIAKCDVLCANCHRKLHYDEAD